MDFITNHLFDCLVLGTIILSGIFAFARGFIQECLALVAWVLAAGAVYRYPETAKPILENHIHNPSALKIASEVVVFLSVLIVFSFIGYLVSRQVRRSGLSAIDRSLGILFGFARGFLIVCLVYMLAIMIFPVRDKSERPEWFKTAKTQPWVQGGSDWIESFLPPDEVATWRKQLGSGEREANTKGDQIIQSVTTKAEAAPGEVQQQIQNGQSATSAFVQKLEQQQQAQPQPQQPVATPQPLVQQPVLLPAPVAPQPQQQQ